MVFIFVLNGVRVGRSFLKFLWVCVGGCVPCAAAFGLSGFVDIYEPEELSCVANNDFVKCARLPTDIYNKNASNAELYAHVDAGTWVDDTNWAHFRNGVPIVGHAENVTVMSMGSMFVTSADCVVTEPFNVKFVGEIASMVKQPGVTVCLYGAQTAVDGEVPSDAAIVGVATALDGDVCPDGFFTVPYESWCGEGMVNISDVPNCDDDTSGEFCLIENAPPTVPCTAGVTTIRTGTGVVVPLWAERATEPSLCVKYNDMVCYANLEAGQVTGAININYNGVIYHTVD